MIGGIEGSVNNPLQVKNQEMRVRRAESLREPNPEGESTIDRVEFSPLATQMSRWDAGDIDFKVVSDVYGRDEIGKLGESEFAALVSNLPDESENSNKLNRLFQKYDEDGDGELSIAEFRKFLSENVFAPPAPPR